MGNTNWSQSDCLTVCQGGNHNTTPTVTWK